MNLHCNDKNKSYSCYRIFYLVLSRRTSYDRSIILHSRVSVIVPLSYFSAFFSTSFHLSLKLRRRRNHARLPESEYDCAITSSQTREELMPTLSHVRAYIQTKERLLPMSTFFSTYLSGTNRPRALWHVGEVKIFSPRLAQLYHVLPSLSWRSTRKITRYLRAREKKKRAECK